MEEKHGLALFCAFILSWTLIKWANRPPARPPIEIPRTEPVRRSRPSPPVDPGAEPAPE